MVLLKFSIISGNFYTIPTFIQQLKKNYRKKVTELNDIFLVTAVL